MFVKISIVAAAFAGFVVTGFAGVIVDEPFNYAPGSNLGGQGGWVNVNTGDEVTVVAGSLSGAGAPPDSGNSVSFGGAGIDPARTFTAETGTLYYSFLLSVSDLGSLDATGGYIAGFGSNSTNFGTTLWTKIDGTGGYLIGMEKRTTVAEVVFDTTSRSLDSTIFVVGSYSFMGAANDDTARLWINPAPSTFGGIEPTPTLIDATGNDLAAAGIERFFLRQDSANETPAVLTVDALRVGTSYADVTIPEPAIPMMLLAGLAFGQLLRRPQVPAG